MSFAFEFSSVAKSDAPLYERDFDPPPEDIVREPHGSERSVARVSPDAASSFLIRSITADLADWKSVKFPFVWMLMYSTRVIAANDTAWSSEKSQVDKFR